MWLKLSNCYPSGKPWIYGLCGFYKGALILCVFCLLTLFPSNLYSQFEADSRDLFEIIEVSGLLKGKKSITVQINLSATIIKDKKIKVGITPTYYESGNPLDAKTMDKLKLRCEVITSEISIQPVNYCSLIYLGVPKIMLINGQANFLDFEFTKGIEFESDLTIHFPFIFFADKVEKNSSIDFKLKVIEKPEEPAVVTKTDSENSGTGNVTAKTESKPGTEKKLQDAASGGGGSGDKGGEGEEKADSISTEPLEKMRNDCKELYNEIYSIYENREESDVTAEQLLKYKGTLDKMRGRIDVLFPTYLQVPEAQTIYESFDRYHEKAIEVLEALNKYINKNENTVLSDKDTQIAQSKKQNKTLQIILIVFGAILLGIVLFVLMKFVMKKIKKNFEKKMKRKAMLELNKQKFKVAQQKNKLRV